MTHSSRRRAGAVMLCAGAWIALSSASAGAESNPAPAPATSSAAALYQAAIANASAAHAVRESSTLSSSQYSETGVGDAIAAAGSESESINVGNARFSFQVVLVGAHLYLNGDQQSLEGLLDLSAFDGGVDAGRWLKVASTSKYYSSLSYGLNLPSAIQQIELAAPFSLAGPLEYHGTRVYEIKSEKGLYASATNGPTAGQFVLYVNATGKPFPVAETVKIVVSNVTRTEVLTFSHWGEAATIEAPTPPLISAG